MSRFIDMRWQIFRKMNSFSSSPILAHGGFTIKIWQAILERDSFSAIRMGPVPV
jgi:hypothetical protein